MSRYKVVFWYEDATKKNAGFIAETGYGFSRDHAINFAKRLLEHMPSDITAEIESEGRNGEGYPTDVVWYGKDANGQVVQVV